MQSDSKKIYKLTSQRTGKSEETYSDVGNFVLKELNKHLSEPKSLIVKLKGVGYWFLRKQRMEIILKHHPIEEDKDRKDFKKYSQYQKYHEKVIRQRIFKERIIEYEEYIKLKRETQKTRHANSVLLRPDQGEDESTKSS